MATPQSIIKAINEPYSLTSDDVQAFRENGYIHLVGVLPDDVLEYYEPIISKITQEHDPAAGVALEDKDIYGKAFIQLGNLWQHDAQVTELVFCKRLARLASELMGTAGVRLYHDQSLYKEPSGGITLACRPAILANGFFQKRDSLDPPAVHTAGNGPAVLWSW